MLNVKPENQGRLPFQSDRDVRPLGSPPLAGSCGLLR